MPETKVEKTTKRVVGVLSAIYFRQGEDPVTGNPMRGPIVARWGEEIELVPSEERRLEANGALLPAGAKPEHAESHHAARVDAYRAERGDQEALQRHAQRLSQGGGGIVNVDLDPEVLSVGELSQRMRDQEPNADDTVALAQGDPRLAEKVLEAERAASGGSPRKTVEQQLQKIIDG